MPARRRRVRTRVPAVSRRRVPRPAPRRTALRAVRLRTSTIPAAVNTASNMRSRQPKKVVSTRNTDRFLHFVIPKGTERGTVVVQQLVATSMTARLRLQGALYQKWSIDEMIFEVQTQTPTTTTGGYVIGITNDPSVRVGVGEEALRTIVALDGSQTAKLWQSTVCHLRPNKTQVLFTSTGQDQRLYSPGTLFLITDGQTENDVSVTINLTWKCKFYNAIRTRAIQSLPQIGLTASCLITGAEKLSYRNWNPADNSLVPTDTTSTYLENAFSGLPPANNLTGQTIWYSMPHPIAISSKREDGTLDLNNVSFIGFTSASNHWEGRLATLPSLERKSWGSENDFILTQSAILTPVQPTEYVGNRVLSFLVRALPSVSVNQQLMIYKEYQMAPLVKLGDKLSRQQKLLQKLQNETAYEYLIQ